MPTLTPDYTKALLRVCPSTSLLLSADDMSMTFRSYLNGFVKGQITATALEAVLLSWGGIPSARELGND
jgi:hypothetical protein